ncbi:hypothetical protein [Lacticaseibacillus sp. 866-1]|uniref:hypothetical protein n=1 Tax=Lacticaseibacillus sp. 866-1 TaxID=2799576 RepID=UPI0019422E4C|nr:hypothetical protein [Lacticaseibacillus sp. 866-1]
MAKKKALTALTHGEGWLVENHPTKAVFLPSLYQKNTNMGAITMQNVNSEFEKLAPIAIKLNQVEAVLTALNDQLADISDLVKRADANKSSTTDALLATQVSNRYETWRNLTELAQDELRDQRQKLEGLE